jgi:hypothetical protein
MGITYYLGTLPFHDGLAEAGNCAIDRFKNLYK